MNEILIKYVYLIDRNLNINLGKIHISDSNRMYFILHQTVT